MCLNIITTNAVHKAEELPPTTLSGCPHHNQVRNAAHLSVLGKGVALASASSS